MIPLALRKKRSSRDANDVGGLRLLGAMHASRTVGLFVSLVLCLSCFSPREDCRILCTSQTECPSGWACVVGSEGKNVCRRPGGPSCGVADAALPDATGDEPLSDVSNDVALDATVDTSEDATNDDVVESVDQVASVDVIADLPPLDLVLEGDASPTDAHDGGLDADGGSGSDTGIDSASDLPPRVDAADASPPDGSDAEPPSTDDAGCPLAIAPPTMVCRGTQCLTLSNAVRTGTMLWLDPSNLGPVGSKVSLWCDQSGQKNHAYALGENNLPQVSRDGVTLAYGTDDAAFVVGNSPSIDLGSDDFLILVVAGIQHGTEAKSIFRKSKGGSEDPQVGIEWLYYPATSVFRLTGFVNETSATSLTATDAGRVRLYGLRRADENLDLRVNGQTLRSLPLVTSGASTRNESDLFLGQFGYGDPRSVDSLHAVVVIRGKLEAAEVGRLESYFVSAFGL